MSLFITASGSFKTMEHTCATERLNNSITTLRNDLVGLFDIFEIVLVFLQYNNYTINVEYVYMK